MITFEQARQAVEAAWPDYDIADYGYEGDADWFVLLRPDTVGGRFAAVSKTTGGIRWINENADEFAQDRPVGAWNNSDRAGTAI
jgi:hypothetical protein